MDILKARDETIRIICENQLKAGTLPPNGIYHRMAELESLDDTCLRLIEIESRYLLHKATQLAVELRKN